MPILGIRYAEFPTHATSERPAETAFTPHCSMILATASWNSSNFDWLRDKLQSAGCEAEFPRSWIQGGTKNHHWRLVILPSLKQRRAGYLRNVQVQNDQVRLKVGIIQHQQGLVTIQGEVEIDRRRQTVDCIANKDCVAEVVFDQ